VDLVFLGIEKYCPASNLAIPYKKAKNEKLSEEEKKENSILSSFRVRVENSIAMLKRYFILRIENRMHEEEKLDQAVELCALLWNFKKNISN